MRIWIGSAVIGTCLCSCLPARASDPVACSAFSKQGDQVTATFVRPHLSLQITAAGSIRPLALSAVTDDAGLVSCNVFIDSDNRNVAVGLNDLKLKPGPLFVVAADLGTGKLVSNFTVSPSVAAGEALKLVGFLQSSSDLVVLGSGVPDHPTRTFSTTLFHVNGQQVNPSETRTVPANALGVGNVSFADAANNHLWFKSSPQFCPLRYVPLVGDGPTEAVVDEANAKAACDVGSAIGYPNKSTLITATTREPNDLVTRVNLPQHKAEEIVLPGTGGSRVYTSVGRGISSPDGEVFAVVRTLLENSLSGDEHSRGTELYAVQVSPLKIIGKVSLKVGTDPASLSIGHRNGAVTVLSFQGGRWNSKPLKVP
jgi:hypothetical protein